MLSLDAHRPWAVLFLEYFFKKSCFILIFQRCAGRGWGGKNNEQNQQTTSKGKSGRDRSNSSRNHRSALAKGRFNNWRYFNTYFNTGQGGASREVQIPQDHE